MNCLRLGMLVGVKDGENVTIHACGALWGWASGVGKVNRLDTAGVSILLPHANCPSGWRSRAREDLIAVRISWSDASKLQEWNDDTRLDSREQWSNLATNP